MDQKKYDKLRSKINGKDFEGNNKNFDTWLFAASYLGNIASIFFSFFLIYPSLYKAISINLTSGILAIVISTTTTILFLGIFEIIKRYLVKNFSFEFISNRKNLKARIFGWSIALISIIFLSFYLSLSGSKNLASTSKIINGIVESDITIKVDSLIHERDSIIKEIKTTKGYVEINKTTNNLREKIDNLELDNRRDKNQYQSIIDKNQIIIDGVDSIITSIDAQYKKEIETEKIKSNAAKTTNESEDSEIIILFIVIAVCGEMIIFIGIYFREYFEYNLYLINNSKFEKIREKKDRYKSLLTYIYDNGKENVGGKVISGENLKTLIATETKIPNPNKFAVDFLGDMDRLGIFMINGKKRLIGVTLNEALNIVENFDDTLQILGNIK